jgi:hypothetical protein
MTPEAALELRRRELERRTADLPLEVDSWRARVKTLVDMNIHFSQMETVATLVATYVDAQKQILADFPSSADKPAYEQSLYKLLISIVAAQRAWNFFRTKFELRTVDRFRRALRAADIVAIDCYDTTMRLAKGAQLIAADAAREPPLTYLGPELSPMTWARGTRPNDGVSEDLAGQTLPVPVIELPFDQLSNVWEFLSIPHEVGHEIDADLKLLPAIKQSLAAAWPEKPDVTPERQRRWVGWMSEILADLIAFQLSGPAFAEMLLNVLILPQPTVVTIVLGDAHPNHFLRMIIATEYIRTMAAKAGDATFAARLNGDADFIEAVWKGIYGDPPALKPYVDDIGLIIKAVMDTPLTVLQGSPLRSLIPYTADHDRNIRDAVPLLRTGAKPPFTLAPRHVVSAARWAVRDWASGGAVDAELAPLVEAALAKIEAGAPVGLRAVTDELMQSAQAKRKRLSAYVAADLATPTAIEGLAAQ